MDSAIETHSRSSFSFNKMALLVIGLSGCFSSSFNLTILLTSLILCASLASIILPVYINSFAFEMPTILDNLCVPHQPGEIPILTSGCPIFALTDAILKSQASAIWHPPPNAKPLIVASTGLAKPFNLV